MTLATEDLLLNTTNSNYISPNSLINNMGSGTIDTYTDYAFKQAISHNAIEEVCKTLQNEIYNILSKEKKYTDEIKKIVDIIDYLRTI
jgi:hypothetical protein